MDNTVEVQELGKVMITNRGEYIPSKSYEILDIVSYNGSSFMSKIDDNTSVPAEEISPDELLINENWQLVAKKGDTYKVTEEDLQAIAKQITDNAESAFNQNVEAKTKDFNTNVTNKLNDYDTNAKSTTETFDANAKKKLDEYNANDTKKLKAYNDNADNKLSAYNTNDTNKLKAYNTNADSKIGEYNTNANSKIAEYDEHSEELRNLAVSTDNELERVKNEILDTGSASDSFIHVEDSCMAKLKELEIEGVINQKTTTGKNLLDYVSNLLTSSNGLTNTLNEDGSITTTGKPIANYSAITKTINITDILEDGQTYKFSRGNASDKIYVQIVIKKVDGTYEYVNSINGSNSFKVNKTIYANYSVAIQSGTTNAWGDRPLTITNKYMLCKGADIVDTSFEPYTGGQPSPSPDFPQKIKTITDNLKVTSFGKNLFDMHKTPYPRIANGLTITTENGYFIINGTCTSTYANLINNANFIIPEGTYTISIDAPQNFSVVLKRTFLDGSLADISIPANSLAKTFITGKISNRYYFFIGGLTPGMTIDNAKFKIQFERKDNPTVIENFVESLIETSLPDGEFIGKLNDVYKDTLSIKYSDNDSKYHIILNKKIGKYAFTGKEEWGMNYGNGMFHSANNFRTASESTRLSKCTHYIYNNANGGMFNSLSNNQFAIQYYNTNTNIFIKDLRYLSIEDFKNMLKENNIEVYYVLAKPYERDLCTINMPLAYKEVTNIFTDSDLLPTINAKYYRTFETTVQNLQINDKSLKQEITDLNVSLVDVIKRLEALESSNATTAEESEVSNDLQN